MKLSELIYRNPAPEPWSEGEKIPWDDPAFSERMLQEHLSQAHDLASRRFEKIDQHVKWIHEYLLGGTPTRILDLGCGPGFYDTRLAKLGHTPVGIDFSPASIAYARAEAEKESLNCEFRLDDLRSTDFGNDYGLAMMLFGEFNAFRPSEARAILKSVSKALLPEGIILLEVSSCDAIYDLGQSLPTWYAVPAGLFSDKPHICLKDFTYDNLMSVSTQRYWILDSETGEITRYAESLQAYTHAELQELLFACGCQEASYYQDFGKDTSIGEKLFLITSTKNPG